MKRPHNYTINLVADYYIKNRTTVRACAKYFSIGKSTIHNYLHKFLPEISPEKYKKVSAIAQLNFSEKHIRGGQSTKQKFKTISLDASQNTKLQTQ
ncbi:MAG: sporulation transcriptional regulator SpoIIID [Clostridia bacterium]|nr:sporulation transcriptional regulator SpoIIID [Clostridia bacterium]